MSHISRVRRIEHVKNPIFRHRQALLQNLFQIQVEYSILFPVLSSIFYSKKSNLSSVFLFQKAKSIFCPGVLNLIIQARNARVFIGTGIARCQVSQLFSAIQMVCVGQFTCVGLLRIMIKVFHSHFLTLLQLLRYSKYCFTNFKFQFSQILDE